MVPLVHQLRTQTGGVNVEHIALLSNTVLNVAGYRVELKGALSQNLNLVRLELTGAQVRDLLEQQWQGADDEGRRLQVSGLTYTWDASRPAGQRIVTVRAQGQLLRPEARYTVAVNEHLAGGGEQLSVLTRGVNPVVGPFVAEALAGYLASCPQPIEAGIQGRISRLN